MAVYLVQHEHGHEDGSSDVKVIGIYATEQDATEACDRLRHLEGFRDHADGFSIDVYEVGRDHWTAGFVPAGGLVGAGSRTEAA